MQNTNDNFFSMDRLVEFGMGMAMSQQIVQNMNNMMESMRRMPQMQVYAQPLYAQPVMQQGVPVQPAYQAFAGQPPVQQAQAVQAVPHTQIAAQQPGATQAGEQPLLPPPLPEVYYIVQDGRQAGPYSGTEIARLVIEKQVSASTPCVEKRPDRMENSRRLYGACRADCACSTGCCSGKCSRYC